MPSCKDICDEKSTKKYDEDEDFDEDNLAIDKEQDVRNTNRIKTKKYNNYFMGGYVARGLPGGCTANTSRCYGGPAIPPGLPPYMTNPYGGRSGGGTNQPRFNYDTEPALMDLYAAAYNRQKYNRSNRQEQNVRESSQVNIDSSNTQAPPMNPEIFTTPPRAGGFVQVYKPRQQSEYVPLDLCQKCQSIYQEQLLDSLSKRSGPYKAYAMKSYLPPRKSNTSDLPDQLPQEEDESGGTVGRSSCYRGVYGGGYKALGYGGTRDNQGNGRDGGYAAYRSYMANTRFDAQTSNPTYNGASGSRRPQYPCMVNSASGSAACRDQSSLAQDNTLHQGTSTDDPGVRSEEVERMEAPQTEESGVNGVNAQEK